MVWWFVRDVYEQGDAIEPTMVIVHTIEQVQCTVASFFLCSDQYGPFFDVTTCGRDQCCSLSSNYQLNTQHR